MQCGWIGCLIYNFDRKGSNKVFITTFCISMILINLITHFETETKKVD